MLRVVSPTGVSRMFSVTIVSVVSHLFFAHTAQAREFTYPIVDTFQTQCSNSQTLVDECPEKGSAYYGQDAQYIGRMPNYTVNDNGTVRDNHTGLLWAQAIDTNGDGRITVADKMTYDQAMVYAANLRLGGYVDWRVPSIKELYSLMMFDGEDPSGLRGKSSATVRPFIDQTVFGFESGDLSAGERLIDSQYVSSTKYVAMTMRGDETVFGVNFIDGRIKGYGTRARRGGEKTFYVLAVRGNSDYGINNYSISGNGTIHDRATGLTWQKSDSEKGMNWGEALEYCETLELAGRTDWRLPNIKELHSIVSYVRSPVTTKSAAIDPSFYSTAITNEAGKRDFPNYWSSTTHVNLQNAKQAAYIAFGRSMGKMHNEWLDVHGAGAQRSDPKVYSGRNYPDGKGPQGDAVRFENFARCVAGGEVTEVEAPSHIERERKTYDLTLEKSPMRSPRRD
ncbi:Lcl C-terminal domain-containing protein [Vibrio agarivorans]|uniref:Lcl C-terminal domain-containing protein n=1 Tax=Vibrio agarivorans TaxID=153622 RepID=UPI002230D380|nr:DUF1566 domain-containing protein [Vibrio agarivorans]